MLSCPIRALMAAAGFVLFGGDVAAQADRRKPPVPLGKAELRICMARETALNAQVDSMQLAQRESSAVVARLADEAKALAEQLRTRVESDGVAVEAFNKRNDARNRDVDVHNKKVEALNAAGAALLEEEANYLEACVSRPYLVQEKNAILKEQGKPPVGPGKGQPDEKAKVRPDRPSA